MEKQVSKAQIGSIVALLVAGKVPHNDAQAFIDKYKGAPSAKKRKKVLEASDHLDAWRVRYPGRVPLFESLILPLYQAKLELKPAIEDFEARLRDTLAWLGVCDVRYVHLHDAIQLHTMTVTNPLEDEVYSAPVDDGLTEDFIDWFFGDPWVPFEQAFYRMLGKPLWDSLEETPCSDFIQDTIYRTLKEIAFGTQDGALKYKPLLDFWLAGNFPAGFDKDHNLLVLVAD